MFTRLTNDVEDASYKACANDFMQLFHDMATIITLDLIPHEKFGMASEIALEAKFVRYLATKVKVQEVLDLAWKMFAVRYGFMISDKLDDRWMCLRLTILDRAGLEP